MKGWLSCECAKMGEWKEQHGQGREGWRTRGPGYCAAWGGARYVQWVKGIPEKAWWWEGGGGGTAADTTMIQVLYSHVWLSATVYTCNRCLTISDLFRPLKNPQSWECSAVLVKSMGFGNRNTWAQTWFHHVLTVMWDNLLSFSEPLSLYL